MQLCVSARASDVLFVASVDLDCCTSVSCAWITVGVIDDVEHFIVWRLILILGEVEGSLQTAFGGF